MSLTRPFLQEPSHWVIKLGSNTLLRDHQTIDRRVFASLVEEIDRLLEHGYEVTVVSSGAVALGRQHMALENSRSTPGYDIGMLQALAAVGQPRLLQMYTEEFANYRRKVAQILFSRGDFESRKAFLNARLAVETLRKLSVIPIINENDTVATEELRFGDNDQLAAMICGLVGADALVLLTDVEGVFEVVDEDGTRSFGAKIDDTTTDDPRLDECAGPTRSGVGRGGMQSKVKAARMAARFGVPTIIAPGKTPGILHQLRTDSKAGTFLGAPPGNVRGPKIWLGSAATPLGKIICDDGAKKAVRENGASLLPKGIVSVEGEFSEGAVVDLVDAAGNAFARGLSVYDAEAVLKIAGHRSDEIQSLLGYRIMDTVVHRDSLVLL